MQVIGLRVEKYIDDVTVGHNCDFEQVKELLERHVLCCKHGEDKYEITLYCEHGECYSGWTTATSAYMSIVKVDQFNGYGFSIINKNTLIDVQQNREDQKNEVFTITEDGGDNYYPSGDYKVNMELFKVNPRNKEKRPVWIFCGDSASGKSFLSHKIEGLTVYETDSSETLPETIVEDVIVLGNKYHFSIEKIDALIEGEHELIVVNFSIQG